MRRLVGSCIAMLLFILLVACGKGLEDCPKGKHWVGKGYGAQCEDDNVPPPVTEEPITGVALYLSNIEDECFNTERAGLTNSNSFALRVTVRAIPIPPNWPPTGKKDIVVPPQTSLGSSVFVGNTKFKSFQDCTRINYNIVDIKRAN